MRLSSIRHLKPGTHFAVFCGSVLAWSISVPAQGFSTPTPGQGTFGPFSSVATVTFQKIKDAMEIKLGGLVIEQIRRVRHVDPRTKAISFPGTQELLKYRPPNKVRDSKFLLTFLGLEGKTLSSGERARLTADFNRQAAYRFNFLGFRISDAAQADSVYTLRFLAYGLRTTKEGVRIVYRMVVLPKKGDRSVWLLELDMMTGYPLYAGEYSRFGHGRRELATELIVTSMRTGMRFPYGTKWWAPSLTVQNVSTELAALKTALKTSQVYVATRRHVPSSFLGVRYQVHTDPYKGKTHALLTYTDGIDHIFIRQRNVPKVTRGADDSIAYLDLDGVTQCVFTHKNVQFMVIGRSYKFRVQDISADMFTRAIDVLK